LGACTLTTIRQPLHEIGRTASHVLINLLENEREGQQEVYSLDVELIVGDSSRLPDREAGHGRGWTGAVGKKYLDKTERL
jgi:hypothetical protein